MKPGSFGGCRATPMPYWPPDAIADSMSRHLRNMAGGAPRDGYEARWVRKDGQRKAVEVPPLGLVFEGDTLQVR